jgi:hypothetical protein
MVKIILSWSHIFGTGSKNLKCSTAVHRSLLIHAAAYGLSVREMTDIALVVAMREPMKIAKEIAAMQEAKADQDQS